MPGMRRDGHAALPSGLFPEVRSLRRHSSLPGPGPQRAVRHPERPRRWPHVVHREQARRAAPMQLLQEDAMTNTATCQRPGCGKSPVRFRGFCSVSCYNMQGHADNVAEGLRLQLEMLERLVLQLAAAPSTLRALVNAPLHPRRPRLPAPGVGWERCTCKVVDRDLRDDPACPYHAGPRDDEPLPEEIEAVAQRIEKALDAVRPSTTPRNLRELQEAGVVDGPMVFSSGISAQAQRAAAKIRSQVASETAPVENVEQTLHRLRQCGWRIAVHNDYMLHGQLHTFWGLTRNGRFVKGEGLSDREALAEVDAALGALAPDPTDC